MKTRTALCLAVAIGALTGASLYTIRVSHRTSPALAAALAAQLAAPPCVKRPDVASLPLDALFAEAERMEKCAPARDKRDRDVSWAQQHLQDGQLKQVDVLGNVAGTLLALVVLAWALPRAYRSSRRLVTTWRAARRAAQVALIADAIRAARAGEEPAVEAPEFGC